MITLLLLASPTVDAFWTDVLDPLFADPRIAIVGACVEIEKPASLFQILRQHLKRGRGGYVIVMALKRLFRPLTDRRLETSAYLRNRDIDLLESDDLYSDATIDFIRARQPDCIFRFGFGFIREPVLSMAPKGVISYHHGDIRKYRGTPVGFWELYAGESRMGVTVQILNDKLDAGKVVVERSIPVRSTDSWSTLEKRAYDQSADMIHQACLLLEREDFEPEIVPEKELGSLYTLPNLREWAALQSRVVWRKVRGAARRQSPQAV
jgi:folate-dependent phosphoribosylglycinamide formyltransferase PurN